MAGEDRHKKSREGNLKGHFIHITKEQYWGGNSEVQENHVYSLTRVMQNISGRYYNGCLWFKKKGLACSKQTGLYNIHINPFNVCCFKGIFALWHTSCAVTTLFPHYLKISLCCNLLLHGFSLFSLLTSLSMTSVMERWDWYALT